jgi:hypothetical protein
MIGVGYNVFDGEELLEYSIDSIRKYVDYIVVIAQEVSNYGQKNENLRETLHRLKELKKIDLIHWYSPTLEYDADGNIKFDNGVGNEQNKRQLALDICKSKGCKIFSSMDCDELYIGEAFEYALNDFIIGDYDSSFCQMKTFYKHPTWEIFPPEKYYVPLFYKVAKNSKFTFEFVPPYPVEIDPSRRMKAGNSRIFTRDEIEMYHYSYVRKDMVSKVSNSSAHFNVEHQREIINHWNDATDIKKGALFLSNQKFNLIECENIFNIKL